MKNGLSRMIREEDGQGMVEYGFGCHCCHLVIGAANRANVYRYRHSVSSIITLISLTNKYKILEEKLK